MPNTDTLKYDLMKMACRYIKEKHPAVVGVAFMELNCKCIKLCGVSWTGRLLDSLTRVSPGRYLEILRRLELRR